MGKMRFHQVVTGSIAAFSRMKLVESHQKWNWQNQKWNQQMTTSALTEKQKSLEKHCQCI
jgi:hypothetical protein